MPHQGRPKERTLKAVIQEPPFKPLERDAGPMITLSDMDESERSRTVASDLPSVPASLDLSSKTSRI